MNKPRLALRNGLWVCALKEERAFIGCWKVGYTPKEAYNNWKRMKEMQAERHFAITYNPKEPV